MRDLPKIDLNLPLLGAAPPALMRDLAARRHIDISGAFTAAGGYVPATGAGFWKLYQMLATLPSGPGDHMRLLEAVLEGCAEQGVRYCEIRLEPALVAAGDPSAWADLVEALTEVALRAEGQVTARLVATCLREQGPDLSRRAATCAAETAGGLVAGFALGGDEGIGAPKDHAWAFDCAREAGLGLAAGAGTGAGPGSHGDAQSIRDTLAALAPTRIDGALRAVTDLALVEDLAERGLTLDLLPAADMAFGRCANWRAHPAGPLYHRGARISLSTGTAAFFGMSQSAIWEKLHQAFDWDEGVFATLAKTAIDAAFCDTATKERLRARVTPA